MLHTDLAEGPRLGSRLIDTTTAPTTKTGYTVTTLEPHSYGLSTDVDDIYAALEAAWQLYKMTECMTVVIDNDPNGDGTVPATRIYEVGAKYVGED